MAYSFNWDYSDLPSSATLAQVISKVNWIGDNLDGAFTSWVEHALNNLDTANTGALELAGNAATAAQNAQASVDSALKNINRCSYLRGTH